jgi:cathepsin B
MVTAVVLLALAAVASAFVNPDSRPAIDELLVNRIKESDAPWEPTLNNRFTNLTIRDVKRLLGTRLDDAFMDAEPRKHQNGIEPVGADEPVGLTVTIPAAFDARTRWPGFIHPIRDQAGCGSCWAFAATEALSDRFAIASNGSINVVLSPQDLISCETSDQYGCDGGYPLNAWKLMQSTGILSDQCYPYTSGNGVDGTCLATSKTCPSGSGTYHVYKAKSAYAVAKTINALQYEIMTYGPIEVTMSVYNDFFSYSSGIYTHTSGALAGGHAIKMLGWGKQNGVPYWICANSWGTNWGMKGYFLIKRGVNEVGIEGYGVAGLPLL